MHFSLTLKNVSGFVNIEELFINVEYDVGEFAAMLEAYTQLAPQLIDMLVAQQEPVDFMDPENHFKVGLND